MGNCPLEGTLGVFFIGHELQELARINFPTSDSRHRTPITIIQQQNNLKSKNLKRQKARKKISLFSILYALLSLQTLEN